MTDTLPAWIREETPDACPVCGRPAQDCIRDLREQFRAYGAQLTSRVTSAR